jgi:hypothetical protein
MVPTLQIFLAIIVPLLVSPTVAAELTYKENAKAPEVWKRGFVFGISRYMTAVAQPDEEPSYPVRCLGNSTDSVLVQQVEGYVKAHPDHANGPRRQALLLLDQNRADQFAIVPQFDARCSAPRCDTEKIV